MRYRRPSPIRIEKKSSARRAPSRLIRRAPAAGIHRGRPEFFGVHLAETLVTLDAVLRKLAARFQSGRDKSFTFAVGDWAYTKRGVAPP